MKQEHQIPDKKTNSLFVALVELGREIQNREDVP